VDGWLARWAPLACLGLLFGLGFVWRTWLQSRRTGRSGVMLFRSGRGAQNAREALLVLGFALAAAEAVAAAFAPDWLARLGVVPGLDGTAPRAAGALVVLAATALLVAAQLDLGASWRIGIEEGARPGLVTDGFYRFCRNPIYAFMVLALAGLVGLVPTWLSIALFAGGFAAVRSQATAEEAYLARTYGDEFRTYARRVGRFVPWLGRLP
jgi:protein-S-isoprenylcysteine O-methyltransferase Ste14